VSSQRVAEFFRLDQEEARGILLEVSEATGRWQEVARRLGIDRASINEMRPAFEHKSADLARSRLPA
jgi:hypothetical protein